MWRWSWLENLFQDVRYGCEAGEDPGFPPCRHDARPRHRRNGDLHVVIDLIQSLPFSELSVSVRNQWQERRIPRGSWAF